MKKISQTKKKEKTQKVTSALKGFKLRIRKCDYRGTVKSAVDSFGPDGDD